MRDCHRGLEEVRALLGALLVSTTASSLSSNEGREIDTGEPSRRLRWPYAPRDQAKPFYDAFIQAALEHNSLSRRFVEGAHDGLADAVGALRSAVVQFHREAEDIMRQ